MNGIDELERMLESRSTDYGKMRQILAFYKLGIDKELEKLQRRLKVSEDALEFAKGSITRECLNDCDHVNECDKSKDGCLCKKKIDEALAAIREENGDTK